MFDPVLEVIRKENKYRKAANKRLKKEVKRGNIRFGHHKNDILRSIEK